MKKIIVSSMITILSVSSLNATNITTDKELIELGKEYLQIKQDKIDKEIKDKKDKEKKDKEWKIKSQIGFSKTDGNTDTTSFTGLVEVSKKIDKHVLSSKFEGQYSEDSGVENKNKINAKLNYNYEITKNFAFDYEIYGEQDKFSGFNYKVYTGPGIKYKFNMPKSHEFKIGVNVLYENDVLDDDSTVDYIAMKSSLEYKWQITETFSAYLNGEYRTDVEDTDVFTTVSNIGMESKLNKHFSVGINYKSEYVNVVPDNKENTDNTLTANLTISY